MADTRTHGVGEGNRNAAMGRHSYLSARNARRSASSPARAKSRRLRALPGQGSRRPWRPRAMPGRRKATASWAERCRVSRPRTCNGNQCRELDASIMGEGVAGGPRAASEPLRAGDRRSGDGRQPPARAERLRGCGARHQGGADRQCRALPPIEAGAAFRATAERVGYQELSGIRRQREAWQREASSDFARGGPSRAFERYQEHGAIYFAENRAQAKEELIKSWSDTAPPRWRKKLRSSWPTPGLTCAS